MSTEPNHITIYTGSEVNIQYLQTILEKAGIRSLVKDNFQSGLRSGFGGGLPGQVQLQVESNHYDEAKKIADATFPPEK